MATLAQLQAQLEALKTARNSGVLTIRSGEHYVQYRTLAEMSQAIRALEADISAAGGKARYRTLRFYTVS